ncbi:MAG: AEC family transporter [Candidatus Saccharibacteria bacterium]|nr:AEC family transporter [Candidatus Saccharibacteria bacterium]
MEIDFNNFYGSLITILIIIALGFALGKFKLISADTNKQLINLLLVIFMPVTLFNAFPAEYNEEYSNLFVQGLLAGIIVMVAMIILAHVIYGWKKFPVKLPKKSSKKSSKKVASIASDKKSHRILSDEMYAQAQFALVFNNATFLGYPIISTTFGEQGIVPYCGFIIAFNLALFSYGVWLFERKLSAKFFLKTITNPNVIAVLLGLILFLRHIILPTPIANAVSFVSNITTPLSLICIGFMLSTAVLGSINKRIKLIVIAAIQLTVAPLATFGLTTLFQFPREVIVICTLIQALPTATSLGLFAEKYGKGHGVSDASGLVIISTALSIITLPIISLILI